MGLLPNVILAKNPFGNRPLMQLYFSSTMRAYIIAGALALVFFILILFGLGNGQKKAQADLVINQVNQLTKALDFFYGDYNRFPTADEFSGQTAMAAYLSRYPQSGDVSAANCPAQAITYSRPTLNNYQLGFCLAAAESGYLKGWNQISK